MSRWNLFRNKHDVKEILEGGYSDADKLNWEVEKLKAEIVNLKRPWIRSPASWIAIATITGALGGLTIQSCRSDREYQLALIRKEKEDRATVRLQDEKAVVLSQLSVAQTTLGQINSSAAEAQKKLDAIQERLKRLQEFVSRLPLTGETRDLAMRLQELTKSASELVAANQSNTHLDETASNLQALASNLNDSSLTPLPAFAIIGSFKERNQAVARAQELLAKGLEYKPQVYEREPSRFALTLGGNLSYPEALKRVNYAKESGLAKDSYVKLAKGWAEVY